MRKTAALSLFAVAVALAGQRAVLAGNADAPERGAPAAAAGDSFDAIAASATRTNDVPTLLAPFVERCEQEKRGVDRSRCAVTQAYLRRVLPGRTFSIIVDDPAAITVSEYDGGIRGFRLVLSGCVACTKPVAVGGSDTATGARRLITAGAPRKDDGGSLSGAVEIAHGAVSFGTVPEAKRWLTEVRPALRAELVFRPSDKEWTFGPHRGHALELLAGRIYNRCTGEILLSKPPSTGLADRPPPGREQEDPACAPQRAAVATATAPAGGSGDTAAAAGPDPLGGAPGGDGDSGGDQQQPSELSRSAIAESMGQIRAQVFACYQKFQVPGTVQLSYEVASNGTVQSIRLGGSLEGTPTGDCVLEAGKNARFPRFQAASQKFTYPFFLRK